MGTGTGRSTGTGTGTTSKRQIPFDVLSRLSQLSPDAADFERRKQQWLDQQDALEKIGKAVPPAVAGGQGIQVDEFHIIDPATGNVYQLGKNAQGDPAYTLLSDGDSKRYIASVGGIAALTSGGSGGGSGQRMASDDPRYWQLQYDQLAEQLMNDGLDAESARRQALATIIANRNNLAGNIADTSASVAKTAADYAAHPQDAYAEAYYANQVGGATPFGDLHNAAFGEYGKTLAEKADRIFSPAQQDLQSARGYRDSIAPVDFLGADQRVQLGLQPTPAQSLTGDTGAIPAAATPPTSPDILTQMTDRLKAMSPEDQANFRKWVTPASAAKGGTFNFDRIYDDRSKPGFSPPSSEGGTNIDIHERAVIVGESGHLYGTLGEKRPDGSMRAEQLIIKPLKSELDKDKKLAESKKAVVESQQKTLASFATGGSVAATPDNLMQQYTLMLQRLGGEHGGGGSSDPFGGTRHVAGAIANEALINPRVRAGLESTYSAKGINPAQLWSDIARFSPTAIRRTPQVSFL